MRQHLTQLASVVALSVLLATAGATFAAPPPRAEDRTVEVPPVPGDDYASGTALLAAQAEAQAAGGSWLLQLGPGIYDLGDRTLYMSENVSIEGAGMGSTLILGSGQATGIDLGRGVVVGSDRTELTSLAIRCHSEAAAGQEACIAMANYQASPRVYRVRLIADGSGSHWGLRNTDSSPLLEEIEVVTSGGSNNYAVVNAGDSHPEIQRSLLTARDGSGQNVALFGKDGGLAPLVDDSELHAVGGTHAFGIYSDGTLGAPGLALSVLDDVLVRAGGGRVTAGIYGGNYELHLQGSTIEAAGVDGNGIQMDATSRIVATNTELLASNVAAAAAEVQLGGTRLESGLVIAGDAVCSGVFRLGDDPAFFASDCPSTGGVSTLAIKVTELAELR